MPSFEHLQCCLLEKKCVLSAAFSLQQHKCVSKEEESQSLWVCVGVNISLGPVPLAFASLWEMPEELNSVLNSSQRSTCWLWLKMLLPCYRHSQESRLYHSVLKMCYACFSPWWCAWVLSPFYSWLKGKLQDYFLNILCNKSFEDQESENTL